jgi:hypothetical protein
MVQRTRVQGQAAEHRRLDKRRWAELDAQKRKLYSDYKQLKENYYALATAHANAKSILFGDAPRREAPQKHHSYDER